MIKVSQSGFTLVELLLAMALFSVILIVSSTGFIAINRTYTRGAIKKQLSESLQNLNIDVSTVLRNPQGNPVLCEQNKSSVNCGGTTYNMVCVSGARYIWQNALDTDTYTGLYRDTGLCTDSVDMSKTINLIDKRFVVSKFEIKKIPGGLYEASGVVRTADSSAQTVTDNTGSIDPAQQSPPVSSIDPFKIKCKGSSAGSIVQTCAVQSFDLIINSRAVAP